MAIPSEEVTPCFAEILEETVAAIDEKMADNYAMRNPAVLSSALSLQNTLIKQKVK